MIRISKLTDYAMLILTYMAQNPALVLQTNQIAAHTQVAKPTVAKILKKLAEKHVLLSQRGSNGGYKLAVGPTELTLANIVDALEGEVAITECSSSLSTCKQAHNCPISLPWIQINRIIYNSLAAFKLSDLLTGTIPAKSCSTESTCNSTMAAKEVSP